MQGPVFHLVENAITVSAPLNRRSSLSLSLSLSLTTCLHYSLLSLSLSPVFRFITFHAPMSFFSKSVLRTNTIFVIPSALSIILEVISIICHQVVDLASGVLVVLYRCSFFLKNFSLVHICNSTYKAYPRMIPTQIMIGNLLVLIYSCLIDGKNTRENLFF
ncbi:unnamed protein product, partial [Musa acuminata var. zebrina]